MVFYEIARTLQSRGHRIYWMTTNEIWTDWLLRRGVNKTDLLQLVYDESDFLSESEKANLQPEIVACEANTDLSMNQCLLMDRFVLYKNKPDINEYVCLYYRDIKRFLIDKKVAYVFAEPTNTNELVTYMICRELGIRFLTARDMRYPRGRVIFNTSYRQSNILSSREPEDTSGELGRQLLEQFTMSQSAPFSFEKLKKEKVIHPKKVMSSGLNRIRLIRNSSRRNLTHHDLTERLRTMTSRVVNGFYMRHLCPYASMDDIPGRLAFFPLHVQPEASIDVEGSYFSDQLKLVKDIRRALPFDTTLVVKEHPNFLGLKRISFFKELRRIPNVVLLRHDVSTFDIYRRASIVFTVTGTPAYEAAMLGIPAVTFSPLFFEGLSAVHYCPDITRLKPLVFKLLDGFERDYEADCRFMSGLVKRSYEGYWTDAVFDSSVMETDNIKKLTRAFVGVVEGDPA